MGALRCFRGIDTITAMSLVAELHNFMRFDSARGLMAFRVWFRASTPPGARNVEGRSLRPATVTCDVY